MFKYLFRALYLLTAGVVCYVGVCFFINLYSYFQLSATSSAHIEKWDIQEVKSGKFIILATYFFEHDFGIERTEFRFLKPLYPNAFLAQDHIKTWQKRSWSVWYNPRFPGQSSLQKLFPFKEGIHLLLSLGVFLYFLWLQAYIKHVNG